jgi:hypothetical protein
MSPNTNFALQRGNSSVIGEAAGHRTSFVVVIDHNRIGQAIFLASAQDVGRESEQIVELAAAPPAVFPIAFTLHPPVILAVANDVDFFNLIHPDVRREHRPVAIPR